MLGFCKNAFPSGGAGQRSRHRLAQPSLKGLAEAPAKIIIFNFLVAVEPKMYSAAKAVILSRT
jgi:hypothetical protein